MKDDTKMVKIGDFRLRLSDIVGYTEAIDSIGVIRTWSIYIVTRYAEIYANCLDEDEFYTDMKMLDDHFLSEDQRTKRNKL